VSFNFVGIESGGFGGFTVTDQLQYNIKFWLDNGFLVHGGYDIITRGLNSFFNTDESKLQKRSDRRYQEGKVWEGEGKEWVWESGIVPANSGALVPFRASGVYIDNIFYDNSISGIFSHHIDYENGRIIFDHPQNPNTNIQAEYTRRTVHVGFADDEQFKILMMNSLEEFIKETSPSGTPSREHQVWLPSVFIEVDEGSQTGLQLGGGQIKKKRIVFHIFGDKPYERNLIMDFIDFQSRKTFFMADLNAIPWIFDQFGDIIPGTTNWPDLISQFPWKKIRIIDSKSRKINSLNTNLFRAKVELIVEIDFGSI